jgi:2-polyprenyl-6-methoxyphenol hydroxylase-like FAD-dependent oxidoreductase
VVGGGIAGMTVACGLASAGIPVDVVERSADWATEGAGVLLHGPTLRALRSLGLLEPVLDLGIGIDELRICDAEGVVKHTAVQAKMIGRDRPAHLAMTRPNLYRALAGSFNERGIPIRLGLALLAIEQGESEVEVSFDSGLTERYALVIAADGLNSTVRRLVWGLAPAPTFAGQAAWRALVPRGSPIGAWTSLYYGPRHKAGVSPNTPELTGVFVLENVVERERVAPEDLVARIRGLLADFGGLVGEARELIERPDQVNHRPLDALLVPPPWHQGRVVLIGDAAHTPTPHLSYGAGMAIEDSVVLSELLAGRDDLPSALEEFSERRFARCQMVVDNSLQLSLWEQANHDPSADPVGLMASSTAALLEPI